MKTAIAQTKPKARVPQKKRAKPEQDLITCDEVERLYDGRWVIMDIRKLSRWNQPEAGIVVFSADTKAELFAYGKKLLKENPKRHYYFFYAGDPSDKLPGVMLHVAVAD
ncbi:MAG: hypothetical protein ACREOI_18295 [bacterium]